MYKRNSPNNKTQAQYTLLLILDAFRLLDIDQLSIEKVMQFIN